MYADDTTAFVTSDSTDDVVRKLNFLFAEICRWCNSSKLTLLDYTGKSEFFSFFFIISSLILPIVYVLLLFNILRNFISP